MRRHSALDNHLTTWHLGSVGLPVTFDDLQFSDSDLHSSLSKLLACCEEEFDVLQVRRQAAGGRVVGKQGGRVAG